jgi:hypothetical protein
MPDNSAAARETSEGPLPDPPPQAGEGAMASPPFDTHDAEYQAKEFR